MSSNRTADATSAANRFGLGAMPGTLDNLRNIVRSLSVADLP